MAFPIIALFTDFGRDGPYVGQMHAALASAAPSVGVIDLMADAPRFDAKRSAYLLASLVDYLPVGAVIIGVIDPGVGTDRDAVIVEADGRYFVGPGNGLFQLVMRHAVTARLWRVIWRPETLSATFHGRDLFAPVAARIAVEGVPEDDGDWCQSMMPSESQGYDWPDDLAEAIYVDEYGNVLTGIRACSAKADERLSVNGISLNRVRTFSDVSPGSAFCYENANGLLEIAVNMGNAAHELGLSVGCSIEVGQPRDVAGLR